jgi:O-methyltransferase
MKLLSDQVSQQEVSVIIRELRRTLGSGATGDVVEFGCYVGTTSVYLQQELKGSQSKLHVYDSFEGLPEKVAQDQSPAGEQFKAGELFATKSQLIKNFKQSNLALPVIHKGWFSALTENDVPLQVAFAYLDGDYYHSILDPLKIIWKRLVPGATVVIDDYQNEQLPGVKKAVDVWAQAHTFNIRVESSLAILKQV